MTGSETLFLTDKNRTAPLFNFIGILASLRLKG